MKCPAGSLASQSDSVAVGQGQTLLSPSAACGVSRLQFIIITTVIKRVPQGSIVKQNLPQTIIVLLIAAASFTDSCYGSCSA